MNEYPRQKLCEIIEHNRDVWNYPSKCEGLLRDFCAQYSKEVFLLVNAQKKGVASELLKPRNHSTQEIILAQLTKRLQDELAITEKAAIWAVDSWGLALKVIFQPRADNSQSEEQLTPEQQQQVEKEQKRSEEYKQKLRQSDQEVQHWKQEVSKVNQGLIKERQQQRLAAFSILATCLFGIYSYTQNQKVINIRNSLYNEVQILQNTLDNIDNTLSSNDYLSYNRYGYLLSKMSKNNSIKPTSTKTYLALCNETSSDKNIISAAIMYRSGGIIWKSTGWWNLKKGQCSEVMNLEYQGSVYIYGQTNNIKWQSNNYSFCVKNEFFEVKRSVPFGIDSSAPCGINEFKVNPVKFLVLPGTNKYTFKDYKSYAE